jgi:hypothetical protein
MRQLFTTLYSVDSSIFLTDFVRELKAAASQAFPEAKHAIALSSYFTLLCWVNHALTLTSRSSVDLGRYILEFMKLQAILLQHCLSRSKKRGLTVSALESTRASWRAVFRQQRAFIEVGVATFIYCLAESDLFPFAAVVMFGIVASVSTEMEKRFLFPGLMIDLCSTTIYNYFTKEIIGGKVRVPRYVMVDGPIARG